MNSILERFRRKQVKRRPESQQPVGMESPAPKREKTIPPHIVACKVCEGNKRRRCLSPVQGLRTCYRIM